MIGADILAAKLAHAGCKYAFGIPGGEVLALIDALERAGIKFILTKHENAAGFMAEGAWHAKGAPGILVATVGPGVANAVNVVANAMQDRVPLLFLTGCVDATLAESYTHQVFDHSALLKPVVKASFRANTGTIGLVTEKALAVALDGQPGPVHIDLPIQVAEEETQENTAAVLSPTSTHDCFVSPHTNALQQTIRILEKAKKPLVIAGVDAVNQGASTDIENFCRTYNLPLITTYKAKGIIDENDPLVLGGAGLSPKADKILLPLLKEADCILLLGYDPIEMRVGWRTPWSTLQNVIEISSVLRTHGMHWVSHQLNGHISPTLHKLDEAITEQIETTEWLDGPIQTARQDLSDSFMPDTKLEAHTFGPEHVFKLLNDVLPNNTIATADSGAHRILLSQIWRCSQPRSLLQSSALCTMGCAVPLAAGYKLADPSKPVVAFVGDAGLEMGLGELATIRDLNIPIIIVVLVDESLALIELKQRASQRPNVGVDFDGTDFPAVAQALGGHGSWIDTVTDLKAAVLDALKQDKFTVLACQIGRRAYDGKL